MRSAACVLLIVSATIVAACGGPTPLGGATLSGPIEIDGVASSGTIAFTVSDDGQAITSVTVELKDVHGGGLSTGLTKSTSYVSIPVADGTIDASVGGIGVVKGRFTSSTEATGTIDLRLQDFAPGQPTQTYELGHWEWSAQIREDAAWPWDDIPLYPGAAGVVDCTSSSMFAQMYVSAGASQVEAWKFRTTGAPEPEEVLAFYEKELEESGWTTKQPAEFDEGTGRLLLLLQKGAEELTLELVQPFGGNVELTVVRAQWER